MSRRIFFWMLPLFFILFSWSDHNVDNESDRVDELKTTNHLIKLVNDYRQSIGKEILVRNSTADKLAAEHTSYMISKNDISPDNFIDRLETLEELENAFNMSENIGFSTSAREVMTAYLDRMWQKANVEGDYTHTGISIKKDANGVYYYTQIFFSKENRDL